MSKRSTEDQENYMELNIIIEKEFKKKLQKHSSILTELSENGAISTAQEIEITKQSPSIMLEVVEDPEILVLDPTVDCESGTETSTCISPEEESLPAEMLKTLGEAPSLQVKSLTDAGKLTCDLQHTESMWRRGYVCSYIKKDIKNQLFNTKIDDHLFGDKLAETLKAAKAINKSGADIKNQPQMQNTQRNNKHLNWKPPPPPPARQAGVTTRQLPAIVATPTTSMATRHHQRRPAQLVQPPMRAYSQRSRTQTQPRK